MYRQKKTAFRTLALLALAALAVAPAGASSHREAPGIARLPQVDATDFYMFRSYEPGRDGFVTLIATTSRCNRRLDDGPPAAHPHAAQQPDLRPPREHQLEFPAGTVEPADGVSQPTGEMVLEG